MMATGRTIPASHMTVRPSIEEPISVDFQPALEDIRWFVARQILSVGVEQMQGILRGEHVFGEDGTGGLATSHQRVINS